MIYPKALKKHTKWYYHESFGVFVKLKYSQVFQF